MSVRDGASAHAVGFEGECARARRHVNVDVPPPPEGLSKAEIAVLVAKIMGKTR